MQITNEEKDTVSAQMKVLAIGDKQQDAIEEVPLSKYYWKERKKVFRNHMQYLLLGTRSTVKVVDDWHLFGRFGAAVHSVNGIPKSYTFYYDKRNSNTAGSISESHVFSGKEVLDDIKQRLSGENWIAENKISAPIKEELERYYKNRFYFIQRTIADVIDAETYRLFNYFLFLHREHEKHKK